jgi:pimeloyl-ACP methyl ester carboxylesterase
MNNSLKILLTLVIITIFINISFAQRKYTITEIQPPATASQIDPVSINNKGEVVGSGSFGRCVDEGGGGGQQIIKSDSKVKNPDKNTTSNLGLRCFSETKPIYWSDQTGSKVLSIPQTTFNGEYSGFLGSAYEINDGGQIVGQILYDNDIGSPEYYRAVTWTNSNSSTQWLVPPADGLEFPTDLSIGYLSSINNNGQILSSRCTSDDNPFYCFFKRWFVSGSGWVTPPIGNLSSSGIYSASPSKINNRGEVVFKTLNSNQKFEIMLYSQNELENITPPLEANESWFDFQIPIINNKGDIFIIGEVNTSTGIKEKQLLIKNSLDNRPITDLSELDFKAKDFNDLEQMIGYDYNGQPIMWSKITGDVKLNDFIPQDNGWTINRVIDLNDNGQILVKAAKNGISGKYALLTPEPLEPLIFVPGVMGSSIRGNFLGANVPFWVNTYLTAPVGLPSVYDLTLNVDSTHYREGLYPSDVIRTVLGTSFYKPLLDSFESLGYKPYDVSRHFAPNRGCDLSQKNNDPNFNPSLFVFPYDWRQDNNQSADKLREYIQCVQQFYPTGTKINVVAHSMGGLVVRRYILQTKSRNESHGLGKVITIASPLLGAPESIYKIYTGGSWEFPTSYAVLAPVAIKFLAPYMPSMQQLFPSRAYHQFYGGIIAEGGDVNGNGIPDEIYTFPQIISYLNSDFPTTTPGTIGAGFHDTIGQDDWREDQSGIEYSHLVAEQNQLNTTTGLAVTKSIFCRINGNTTLTRCHNGVLYTPDKGYGDKTVPTVSASRYKDGVYLGAPNSNWYIYRSSSVDNDTNAEHTGITQLDKTHKLVAYLLGVGPRPELGSSVPFSSGAKDFSANKKINNANLEAAALIDETRYREYNANTLPVQPELSTYSPARYLTITGRTEVIVRDESGNMASIQDGLLSNKVRGLTNYEVIGENSIMLTFAVGHSYTIEFPAGEVPMGMNLVEGRGNRQPTSAVRYNDLNIPANLNVKFTISQTGTAEFRYDADNNGEFETLVPPTAFVTGAAAGDTTSPTVSLNIVQQGNTATATITAQDTQSGVNRVWYSLDGLNFQIYTSPVTLQYSSTAVTIYSFADDAVANRSGLHSKTFTFTQTQPTLAVKPVLECVAPNSNGTFTAKFGYLNENSIPATIPVGSGNKFTPLPQDRGQITNFQPGRIRFAFNVPFDGNNLVWTLRSPNGSQRTSTASRNSTRCQ